MSLRVDEVQYTVKDMKKIILIFLIFIMMGCSTTQENSKDLKRVITIQGEEKYDEIIEILSPLLIGGLQEENMINETVLSMLEADEIQLEKLEELKEFMLVYYTEEIANETCNLISYKIQLKNDIYNTENRIYNLDSLWEDMETRDSVSNLKEFEIIYAEKRTMDRIVVVLKGINNIKEYSPFVVVLEREGDKWFLGDLVFSRRKLDVLRIVQRRNRL